MGNGVVGAHGNLAQTLVVMEEDREAENAITHLPLMVVLSAKVGMSRTNTAIYHHVHVKI